ncbi:hypothetical protein [Gracilimonas sp.]|uniref:hypothetical protein n=1 Tax=Gracilimonas sp. TaxID=1974203 RepID=UPI002871B81D|nr:hypothetical protein [Gracilimonas sp.]
MIDKLISIQLRVKLLQKFFINLELKSDLKGLSREFELSSNTVPQELNRLQKAGIIEAEPKAI